MTFGFARKFISRLESFLPIDPTGDTRLSPLLLLRAYFFWRTWENEAYSLAALASAHNRTSLALPTLYLPFMGGEGTLTAESGGLQKGWNLDRYGKLCPL